MACRKIALVLAVLLFFPACFAVEIENSAMVQSVRATVVLQGSGRIGGNLMGQGVEIEVLSFKETESQRIVSLNETLEINGKAVSAERSQDEWENSYALFEVSETGQFNYRIEAVIETEAVFPDLQDFDLENGIDSFQKFGQPSKNIESNSEAIRTVALNRFDSNSWLETVVDITQWTYDSLEYDLLYFPKTHSALETLVTKKGVCDEFAVLAAAMLRAKGIPTRLVTGLTYNPQSGKGWDNHAWLEAYNPNSGWIALDPTFGEAGVVDGTHIVRGFFSDPADSSVSKAKAVQTASVDFGENFVQIEVEAAKPFDVVFSFEADKVVMPANKWHDLHIIAKNLRNNWTVGWFSLVLPEGFESDGKRKIVLFEGKEEKQLEWKIRVDTELKKGEYLSGKYRVAGIGQVLERNLKVLPGTAFIEEAEIRLVDLLPIVGGNRLVVEIIVENIGAKKAGVEIEIDGNTYKIEIAGFESKTASIVVSNAGNRDYRVSVKGPGLLYETTITLYEGRPLPVQAGQPPAAGTRAGEELTAQIAKQLFTMESAFLAGIIAGIVLIVLLLKELLTE